MFYVYRLFDLTGETLYIGKGCKGRLNSQRRKYGLLGEVLSEFTSERAAYGHERKLIKAHQPRLNKCAGGAGPRSRAKVARKPQWQKDMERIGTRVYAARELLRFDLSGYLDAATIAQIRVVASSNVPLN